MKEVTSYQVTYVNLEDNGTYSKEFEGLFDALSFACQNSFPRGAGAEVFRLITKIVNDNSPPDTFRTPVFMVHGKDIYKLTPA
jgi:hypothetical protein